MKIYNTKNGKVIYINNEQIIINNETANLLENWGSWLNTFTPNRYKVIDSELFEVAKRASLHINEIEECKIEYLLIDGVPVVGLLTDELNDCNRYALDKENILKSFEDFKTWLG